MALSQKRHHKQIDPYPLVSQFVRDDGHHTLLLLVAGRDGVNEQIHFAIRDQSPVKSWNKVRIRYYFYSAVFNTAHSPIFHGASCKGRNSHHVQLGQGVGNVKEFVVSLE